MASNDLFLAISGYFLLPLVTSGYFWQFLAILATSGYFLQLLAISGYFWLFLAIFVSDYF